MKFKRWTTLLQNQAVAVILLLLFMVPMLFGSDQTRRAEQFTAFGFLGLLLLSVWLFRVRDGVTLARVRGFLLAGPNLPIVLFLIWGGITTALSSEPLYSRFSLVQMAVGVVVYAVIVYQFRHKEHIRALLSALLMVGVALVVTALALDRGRDLRDLAGAFHDRQLFGAFLGLILPVTLGIAIGTRNRLWKLGASLACVLIAGGLMLTTCRSSWLGLATAVGFFGLLCLVFVWKIQGITSGEHSFWRKKHELLVTPLIILAAIGIFVSFTNSSSPIVNRLGTLQRVSEDDSVKDRFKLWSIGTQAIQARPVFGWGPGSYAFAQERFNPESRSRSVIQQLGPSLTESPHNTYIQTAAEMGLVGLALYLAILGAFFYRGINALPRMDRGLRQYTLVGCLSAIAGQAVDGIANPAYMYPEVSTFVWVVLGMGMCAAGLAQEVRDEKPEAPEQPMLGIPRFLYRGMRTATLFCAVVWIAAQLLNLNAVTAASAGVGKSAKVARTVHRPIYCDQITHLEIDWLDDQIPVPAAFNVNAGAIYQDRLARFKIYAATDDPRFYADVTTEVKAIKFKLHGLKGKFVYQQSSNIPVFYFKPKKKKKMAGKTGTIEVTYRCKAPRVNYKTRFFLTILPSGEPINEAATVNGARAQAVDTPSVDFLDTLPGLFVLPTDDGDPDSVTEFDTTLPE